MEKLKSYRIGSIDLLRGLIMLIMALDHVRLFFHYGFFYADPTDLETTTPVLFFTRWITHYCAPVFVFLAGTAAYLYGAKQSSKHILSRFLLTRGLWLIFLEVTIVNFSVWFDLTFSIHMLQVIWAIGLSMVLLAAFVYLPKKYLLLAGILIVSGHNLLDRVHMEGTTIASVIWHVLHEKHTYLTSPDAMVVVLYPVLPWLGVMILGYCFGTLYHTGMEPAVRKKWLVGLGAGAVFLFILIRAINMYGDPVPWQVQKNGMYTVLSFLNTTKYPPSLLYLLMTLGPSILFLYAVEHMKNKVSDALVTIGKVPLFYYIVHFFVIHLLAVGGLLVTGQDWRMMIITADKFMSEALLQYGYDLWLVYVVWAAVILLLYPLSRWFYQYKYRNRHHWWISYL